MHSASLTARGAVVVRLHTLALHMKRTTGGEVKRSASRSRGPEVAPLRRVSMFVISSTALAMVTGCGYNGLKYDPSTQEVCSVNESALLHLRVIQGSHYVRLRIKPGLHPHCININEPLSQYTVENNWGMCCVDEWGNFYLDPNASYEIENLTVGDAASVPIVIPPRTGKAVN